MSREQMKARLEAATEAAPLPWQAAGTGARGGDHWYVCAEDQSIASIACSDGENEEQREPLARFFTAAPTDLAKLHAALDAVEALADRWEEDFPHKAWQVRKAIRDALGEDQ